MFKKICCSCPLFIIIGYYGLLGWKKYMEMYNYPISDVLKNILTLTSVVGVLYICFCAIKTTINSDNHEYMFIISIRTFFHIIVGSFLGFGYILYYLLFEPNIFLYLLPPFTFCLENVLERIFIFCIKRKAINN